MSRYGPLVGRIQQDLADLEQLTHQTSTLLQKALKTEDDDYFGSIALNIHSFYTGTERIFREIAREIDQGLPEGSDWHRQLLRQMSAEIPDTRPAVISVETRNRLNEYCAFRHVVRNIYTFNLQAKRVQELAVELPDCYQQVAKELQQFCQVLLSL